MRTVPRKRILTVSCLVAALVAVAVVGVAYAREQASDREAARVALVEQDTKVAAALAATELAAAVKTQKANDRRILKRVIRKMRAARREAMKSSYAQGQSDGYSSGNAAGEATGRQQGYEDGSIDGYLDGTTDGLIQGSDELDCSDDPDVTWLPPCY